MAKNDIPSYVNFMNPVIIALKDLGSSGTIEEINNKVSEISGLSDEQLEILHNPEKGGQTEVEYRLAWARTYLKKYGAIENSARGVWALTAEGKGIDNFDQAKVRDIVNKKFKEKKDINKGLLSSKENDFCETELETSWRDELLETLLKMEPSSFERLVQRLLRESGFIQVEVTGKSGDGGIDGKGIMRLGGLLSFHVIFQCKRYQGSITSSQIRDFRGAMVGRADKALFITTGNYTKDAVKEASRDGAPAIDLIDGGQLINKLKELGMGIKTEKIEVEQITVNHSWFFNV